MRRYLLLALVLMLLVGVVAVAPALATKPVKEVPFRATLGGDTASFNDNPDTVAARCDNEDALFVTTFEGTGRATHLGRVEVEAQHCSQPLTTDPLGPVVYGEGRLTLTAANGDVLEAAYFDGYSELFDFGPDGPVFEFTDTFEFMDGGTGRFTFASGGGTETGFFTPSTSEWSVVMEGTIAYGRK